MKRRYWFENEVDLPLADEVRWELILEALERCDDNPFQAGAMIGISGRTILREIENRDASAFHNRERYPTVNKRLHISQIQKALRDAGGNAERAAASLGYRDGGIVIRKMIRDGRLKP